MRRNHLSCLQHATSSLILCRARGQVMHILLSLCLSCVQNAADKASEVGNDAKKAAADAKVMPFIHHAVPWPPHVDHGSKVLFLTGFRTLSNA